MTNSQLTKNLQAVKSQLAPKSEWLSSSREALLRRIRQDVAMEPSFSVVERARIIGWNVEALFTDVFSAGTRRTLAAGLLALIFTVGTGSYVVTAANGSVPGEPLYNLKIAVESARLALTRTPQQRVALEVDFAGRRLGEATVLTQQKGGAVPQIAELVGQFQNKLTEVAAKASEVSESQPNQGIEIARIVDARLDDYVHALETTKSAGSPELSSSVGKAIAAVNRAETETLKVIAEKNPGDTSVASRLDQKIKVAENNLDIASAASGAKGNLEAKANLKEAKEKIVSGDYLAAIAIIKKVEDVVYSLDVPEEKQTTQGAPATDKSLDAGKIPAGDKPAEGGKVLGETSGSTSADAGAQDPTKVNAQSDAGNSTKVSIPENTVSAPDGSSSTH
ncbi:MAG: DUF5667 domain-containing protein [Patescibacteria group bacterium]|jgi:hypothetical protein